MAAPLFVHYSSVGNDVANTAVLVGPTVPTGRALIVSKIVICNASGSVAQKVDLFAGNVTTAHFLLGDYPLAVLETFEGFAGVVLTAGQGIHFRAIDIATAVGINVFGQEVDN